ncbi:hypothetical protein HE1_00612 [Holospora elegans E1]|uniref:J domain-containing protein n=1 Tax=Holospora elegans E1 TaxID=1427503 RepID=A0A023DY80_9PROT|nr:J domain-containing protein [Holospora elegans]GAJ46284.1 hypothetical protein HE1_00612 [Holospora elegans E1]
MEFSSVGPSNWFDLFGLPKRFLLDLDELERAYIQVQKVVHPDCWSGVSFKVAAQMSSHVNMVYGALKEPKKRAEYMLKCAGFWPVPSFPKIMEEIFFLKSQFNQELFDSKYQDAILSFDEAFQKEHYVQAQQAYLYICYLEK